MSALKNSVLQFGYYSGFFRLAQRMTSNNPRILVYHAFSEVATESTYHLPRDVFRIQLHHIAKRYKVVRLTDVAESVAARKPLPPNSLAITVDDGYENFYRYGYPLLCEFRMPATVFVVTRLLEENAWTWADQMNALAALPHPPESLKASNYEATRIRLLRTAPESRDCELERMAAESGARLSQTAPPEYRLATWEMLREMKSTGLIDIGGHTRNHPALSTLDEDQTWDEVKGCSDDIARNLGASPASFCYPFGNPGDFTEHQESLVLRAGFTCAVPSLEGFVTPGCRLGALPRVGACGQSMAHFSKYLDGPEYLQRRTFA